jgi:hypothetical protein
MSTTDPARRRERTSKGWNFSRRLFQSLELFVLLAWSGAAGAQSLGGAIFFSGTVTTSSIGQSWAYVVWQATDAALLQAQPVAVYRKVGGPGSTNAFALAGVADYQLDPRVITLLNQKAVQLGDDLAAVGEHIDQLFTGLVPAPTLPTEDKLAGVLQGSLGLAEHYDNLTLLGRRHPAVALAMGQAWAEPIAAGATTFEMRQFDLATQQPGLVMGRVTVTAGSPVILPAPGQPEALVESSAVGHLNVRLRWTSPPELRRLSLLQFGNNVFRMSQGFAVSNGFATNPPAAAVLRALLVSQSNQVRQLNHLPVLADEDEAGTNDFFFVDDNNQFAAGGRPLGDGERYYYFVTARDLLGRDGEVSTGRLAVVCDRFPPAPPLRLRVERVHAFTNGVSTNHLRVTWRQNDNSGSHTTVAYYVHRWTSSTNADFRSMTNHAAGLLAGPIAHVPGARFNSFLDTTVPATNGVPFQYTVRAIDAGACGFNWSGHSGPAFGNLQDWVGPSAPTGVIYVTCLQPRITTNAPSTLPRLATNQPYRLACGRDLLPPGIAWAEFWIAEGVQNGVSALPGAHYLGRRYFSSTALVVSVDAVVTGDQQYAATLYCRAGTAGGRITEPAWTVAYDNDATKTRVARFHAHQEEVTSPPGEPCEGIDIPPEDPLGLFIWTNRFPTFHIPTGGDVYEFRIFRSLDGGPRSLVLQGTNLPSTDLSNLHDRVSGPLHCAEACYFLQFFDQHGNGTGIGEIGCIQASILTPDTAQNVSLVATGTVAAPAFTASWEIDPPGIERFEVWVGVSSGAPPTLLTADLSTNISPRDTVLRVLDNGVEREVQFGTYLSGRIGTAFGTASQRVFTVTFNVVQGRRYYLFVRARSACSVGPDSAVRSAIWTQPATGPEVPWPARPLPEVLGDFHPDLVAFYVAPTANASRATSVAAVRIGEVPIAFQGSFPVDFPIAGTNPPSEYVYTDQNGGGSLLPFVLYRYQVPNAKFPNAPGDVVQVSPLIEDIAYGPAFDTTYVRDPFIDVVLKTYEDEGRAYLYLMDTQPVVRGAKYRYLLVQFGRGGNPNNEGEPVRVIPTNELTIP